MGTVNPRTSLAREQMFSQVIGFTFWAMAFAAYAVAEFTVHQRSGAAEAVLYDTPFVLVRTVLGLAMRYLVMASTSLGVSAFHEPEPIRSLLDPWWLFSLLALALLGWRTIVVWRRREPEVAYWVWAMVSFGPVSQIFPFLYPLADRYLYFILPGLLGGTLLAGQSAAFHIWPGRDERRRAASRTQARSCRRSRGRNLDRQRTAPAPGG